MSDLGNLLQMIYDLLTGWLNSFTSHAAEVMEKLNLIEEDTDTIVSNTSDIADDTNDIKDNTGAIITPVNSIKTNTDSIKNDTTTIKNNVSTMTNQLGTISTNVGTASAFTEDVANNTLDIKDRVVTIGSDTTQLRSNSNTITSDVSDIKTALNYYLANTPVTEDVEGSICNIDTDLADYLQACKVTIPADQTGFTGITLTKLGKNLLSMKILDGASYNSPVGTQFNLTDSVKTFTKNENVYSITFVNTWSYASILCPVNDTDTFYRNFSWSSDNLFGCSMYFLDKDYTVLSLFNNTNVSGSYSGVLTVPAGAKYYLILFTNRGSTNTTITITNPYVVIGSSSTTYEDYKAMTYPVTFGTTITDGAEINLLDGIIKVNSTPVSYQSITPIAVRTYKGINNIYSDVGTTALTYRETLKHYMDKQEA